MSEQEYRPGQLETPIAFMIFNRPDYTKEVFAEIRKAQPKKLFIIADGPRTPSEEAICAETRAVVETIDWPCEVHRNYAERNLGLKERFRSGLNWYFEQVEQGIILEDDCLPHPSFFRFATEMLDRYKDNEQIMMISGDNFMPEIKMRESYGFSKYFPIWGWATWRRSWNKYDIEMKNWGKLGGKRFLKKTYSGDQKYMRNYMTKIFDDAYSNRLKSWDTQWLYACLANEGLCIIPKANLVSNIGILGTHTSGHNQNLPIQNIYQNNELTHPKSIEPITEYDDAFYRKNFTPRPFNLRKWVISILVKYEFLKKIYRLFRKIYFSE